MVAELLSFHSPPRVSGGLGSRSPPAAAALSRYGCPSDPQTLVGCGGTQVAPRSGPFLIDSPALATQTRAAWVTSAGDFNKNSCSGGVDATYIEWFLACWSEFHTRLTFVQATPFIRKLPLLHPLPSDPVMLS